MSQNNTQQAAWIAVGNFFSFLIGIVSPMILCRFFTKADYGTYKQVMYVYDTLLVVFTLGLPKTYAYFLPRFPLEQSKAIINKITRVFFILGGLFSICLFLCADPIARWLGNSDLAFALKLFSPTPFFLIPTLGLDGIYASFHKTQYVALYTILTKVFTIVCIVLPVLCFDGNYIHAIIGFDIASVLTFLVAMYMKNAPVKKYDHLPTTVTYKNIFSFAFPLLYACIWGTIINSSNQFFISRYFGNSDFAVYSNGFMSNPLVGMIVGGMGAVLLPVFSKMGSNGNDTSGIFSVWRSSLIKSSKFIFPILVFSIAFSTLLMTCMYGKMYSDSSIYFQIRNASALLQIIPFAPIILAIGKTKAYANAHLVTAVLIVTLEYIAVHMFDTPIAIAIVSEFCRVFNIFLQMSIIARYFRVSLSFMFPISVLGKILLISILATIPSIILSTLVLWNHFILLLGCFVLYVVAYWALCWVFHISYREIFANLLRLKSSNSLMRLVP